MICKQAKLRKKLHVGTEKDNQQQVSAKHFKRQQNVQMAANKSKCLN